jgi:hypothetical protein
VPPNPRDEEEKKYLPQTILINFKVRTIDLSLMINYSQRKTCFTSLNSASLLKMESLAM